jgi:hypothetical protein
MKTLSVLILVFFLLGCATTDYSKLQLSSATIKNLKITEIKNLEKRKHKIQVSFDYDISKFNDVNGLYHCSVQFVLNNNTTMTIHKSNKAPCEINSATGHISINWPSPIDRSLNTSKKTLSMMIYPLEFFIAIHQDTSKKTNRFIGRSESRISEI